MPGLNFGSFSTRIFSTIAATSSEFLILWDTSDSYVVVLEYVPTFSSAVYFEAFPHFLLPRGFLHLILELMDFVLSCYYSVKTFH